MKTKQQGLLSQAFSDSAQHARLTTASAAIFSVIVPIVTLVVTWFESKSVSWSSICTLCAVALILAVMFLWNLMVRIPRRQLKAEVDTLAAKVEALEAQIQTMSAAQAPPTALLKHDQKLFRLFSKIFPKAQLQFLRDHDFHNSVFWSKLDSIDDFVADWQGARYEFADPVFNEKLTECKKAAHAFIKVAVMSLYPIGDAGLMTPRTNEDAHDFTTHTEEKIGRMNELASDLVKAVDAVTREATSRDLTPFVLTTTKARH